MGNKTNIQIVHEKHNTVLSRTKNYESHDFRVLYYMQIFIYFVCPLKTCSRINDGQMWRCEEDCASDVNSKIPTGFNIHYVIVRNMHHSSSDSDQSKHSKMSMPPVIKPGKTVETFASKGF